MNVITDFYQFKYSRDSYYRDLFINTKGRRKGKSKSRRIRSKFI